MLSKEQFWIDPKLIVVPEGRQRKGEIDTSDLEPSVRERGIYNPIIVRREPLYELVAGERRTRTALKLGLSEVPIRFAETLSPIELRIIELEENERRKDLHWMDQVRAISELHALYARKAEYEETKWSAAKTAEILFYDPAHISHVLRVARDLTSPKIAAAPGLRAAYNILSRFDERAIGDAMSSIAQAGAAVLGPKPAPAGAAPAASSGEPERQRAVEPPAPAVPEEEISILQADFVSWAEGYEGERFSFAHVDFPYGINAFAGPQAGRDKWTTYDDDPNVYWSLIRAFCANKDRFMAQSSHVMFWLSADIEMMQDTVELFAKLAPDLKFWPKPLIWHKSDNVGVLSDPKRGPRHIYEACLIGSTYDRYIVQAVSDLYACPTNKDHHPSTKPEPMLRYFMRMFVDEHTTMFDPTCGSGASLRAAESLGAKRVLGLEIDPEHCTNARSALRQFRMKAKMAKAGVKS